MLERLSRTRRNVALAILGALVLWFCWSIRSVLNPLILGYLAAFILHPLVEKVQQHGFSRRSAVNLIFGIGLVAFVLVVLGLGIQFRELAREVVTNDRVQEQVQQQLDDFTVWMRETVGLDIGRLPPPDIASIRAYLQEFLEDYGAAVRSAGGAGIRVAGEAFDFVLRLIGSLLGIGGLFLLVPLYTYYLLFELGRIHRFVSRYMPVRDRERIGRVGAQIGEVIASFFRGRLGVCLIKGLLLSLGLLLAGVDYAFLFGMVSGFLSLVPFVGPAIGFVLAFMVGMLEHGVLGSLLRTGVVFGLGELIEGYVLIPKILGDSLGLHPVVVLFALIAGGAALGMLGILIALPLTAALVIVVREFVLPALGDLADEGGAPPRGARAAPVGPASREPVEPLGAPGATGAGAPPERPTRSV